MVRLFIIRINGGFYVNYFLFWKVELFPPYQNLFNKRLKKAGFPPKTGQLASMKSTSVVIRKIKIDPYHIRNVSSNFGQIRTATIIKGTLKH